MLGFINKLFGRKVANQDEDKKESRFFIGTVMSKEELYRAIGEGEVTCFEIREDDSSIHRAAMLGHRTPIYLGDRVEMSLTEETCGNKIQTESVEGEDGRVRVINTRIFYYQIDEYRILPKEELDAEGVV